MARYLKVKEVAELFNISKSAVNNYVKQGIIPKPIRLGSSRRWNAEQLAEFEQNL